MNCDNIALCCCVYFSLKKMDRSDFRSAVSLIDKRCNWHLNNVLK